MKFSLFTPKKIKTQLQRGFSFVELIVVIGIFTLIMSVALFNQSKLNNNILLTNLAYEIALLVRETQAYGIGVRATDASQGFSGGYGISFDPRTPQQMVLFNDKNNNHQYDAGDGELASTYIIQNQRGNSVVRQCIGEASDAQCPIDSPLINIIFRRPNPEAIFYKVAVSGESLQGVTDNAQGPAYIIVKTPGGDNCRVVVVEGTGQIRVEGKDSSKCQQ